MFVKHLNHPKFLKIQLPNAILIKIHHINFQYNLMGILLVNALSFHKCV